MQSRKAMHQFADTLADILRRRGLTQKAYAELIGVDRGLLTRWLGRACLPDPQRWPQLLEPLTHEEQVELTVAYMQAKLPPGAADLVEIVAVQPAHA